MPIDNTEVILDSELNDKFVPVTLLTGFLGSGKTTLLNRILSEQHGHKIAVIENEFGEVGIDSDLLIKSDEQIVEVNNGCICCTVRGDLVRILGELAKRRDCGDISFDRVIIETTGLADPAPVAQTFFVEEDIGNYYRLDAIITVVDAKHAQQQLDAQKIAQKNKAVFKNISKMWQFQFPSARPEITATLNTWNAWRQFEIELLQKPKSTLSAFQLKTKNIASKADVLSTSIPMEYNKPQVMSRLAALNTKLKSLELYLNLSIIPEQKVAQLIPEINEEIKGLYNQWDEIIIKKAIPKEIGEELMLQALDTTRNARPDLMKQKMEISDKIK